MKSLSPSKPLVMMLMGKPGAGKSFFARQFSETFGAPVVSFDRLRYELFNDPTYNAEEQAIVQRIAEYQIEELLKTHKTLLIDGGCNARTDRHRYAQLAKAQGYGILTVWVQTDDPTSLYRAMHRDARRTDDKYSPSITSEIYDSLTKRLSPPVGHEPVVVISGKHTYSTQARAVLKKLVTPRVEPPTPPEREHPLHPPASGGGGPERPEPPAPRRRPIPVDG